MEFECFSIYGFSVDYPATWQVELDKKSERKKGHVAFKSPEGLAIFVSWGLLEEAKKKFSSSHEQAEASLGKLKKSPGVKTVELIEARSVEINSHRASFNHAKVISSRASRIPLLSLEKTFQQEIRSLHLHCGPSKRFFAIYGMTTPERSLEHADLFESMLKSFRCHTREENLPLE